MVLAVPLYLAYLPKYYVGFFNDDASFVAGAMSLLRGSYRALFIVGEPPMPSYLPGYPFFLAPFVWLVSPHWPLLKLSTLLLTIANLLLVWRLFAFWLPAEGRLLAMALVAFNPVWASYSGAVMSEPLFLTLVLLVFILEYRLIHHETRWGGWALGFLAAWAIHTRPIGVVLIPSVARGLLLAQRSRSAAKFLLLIVAITAGLKASNYFPYSGSSSYTTAWIHSLQQLSDPVRMVDHLNRLSNAFLVLLPLGVRLRYGPPGLILSAMLALPVFLVMAKSLFSWRTMPGPTAAFTASLFTYLCAFVGVHAFWTYIDVRYGLPILPFLIGFLILGGRALCREHGRKVRIAYASAGLFLILLCFWNNAHDLGKYLQWRHEPGNSLPHETLSWMKEHLPPGSIPQSARSPEVFLYTFLPCVGVISAANRYEYRYQLLRSGVTHIVVLPVLVQPSPEKISQSWMLNRRWASSWPDAFRPVYQSSTEGSVVYEVIADTRFREAYDLYLRGVDALQSSRQRDALKLLDEALRLFPSLTEALNAFGAACLLTGRSLGKAEVYFKRAVRIQPGYAVAWMNLSRLYRRRGESAKARRALERAIVAGAVNAPEYDFLLPALQAELASSR